MRLATAAALICAAANAGCGTGAPASPAMCADGLCATPAAIDGGSASDASIAVGADGAPSSNPPPSAVPEAGDPNACAGYDSSQAPHAGTLAGVFLAGGFAQHSAVSTDGAHWADNGYVPVVTTDGAAPAEPALLGIAQGNGTLVAAGWTGVLSSADAKTWTPRAVPNVSQYVAYASGFTAIAFGKGTFVMAAAQVFNPLVFYRSTDGLHWTDPAFPVGGAINRPIRAITFADGKFVAVGSGRRTVVSDDGLAWHSDTQGSTDEQSIYTAVAFGNGTWVAVGTGSALAWSVDGVSWTDASQTNALGDFKGLVYDGTKFLTCSRFACYTTTDGKTWTAGPGASTDPRPSEALAFAGGVYVGLGVPANVLTSADGMTWTPVFCGAPPALQTLTLWSK